MARGISDAPALGVVLRRGALVTAANWPLVVIEFVADATFQGLLAVPVVGATLLVAMLLGADIRRIAAGSLSDAVTTVVRALLVEPVALWAFVAALGTAYVGGSIVVFLVRGGIIDVLAAGTATAGVIERPPLRLAMVRRAGRFSLERFTAGCVRLFPSYLRLGLLLLIVEGASGGLCAGAFYGGYLALRRGPLVVGALAVTLSLVLLAAWIAAVNLVYVLVQVALALQEERPTVRRALRSALSFLRVDGGAVMAIFGVWIALAVLASIASALAWSGVGLVAFVPFVGIAVVPLQLAALVVRGVLFGYLGLTAVSAYLILYRSYLQRVSGGDAPGSVPGLGSSVGRTA